MLHSTEKQMIDKTEADMSKDTIFLPVCSKEVKTRNPEPESFKN